MEGRQIGFVGGGRITAILIQSMRDAKQPIGGILVSDSDESVRRSLAKRFPEVEVTDDNRRPAQRDVVFLSLHPPVLKQVAATLAHGLPAQSLVVSLAPVLTLSRLDALLGGFERLVRMIPNAPSLVHDGYNPVCFAPAVSDGERARLGKLLDVFGKHPEVAEQELEGYAILTAMSPTYFWFQWQTLRELGASFGLRREEVDAGLSAAVHGAARLLFESGLSFDAVEDMVPVKPLADAAPQIRDALERVLGQLHRKLREQ